MKVYLDNAATTPIDPEVIEAMIPVLKEKFGNPSSIHLFGRETKATLEIARRHIAKLVGASPGEIFFTSGGTEANNMAIRCGISDNGITHAITSPLEHHAVLHTMESLEQEGLIKLSLVKIDVKGNVDLDHLEELLSNNPRSFVSLMHANNEIGSILPINKVGEICKKYNAIFHSDTVQTMGHYPHNLSETPVDFVTCAAHKFHGPKGIGFIYINSDVKIKPFITGGSQERNMRGGTENVIGIVGLEKALEIAYRDLEHDRKHIESIKKYMYSRLMSEMDDIQLNGILDDSLYTVLNVSFPPSEISEMLLFSLDISGIAASGGSACSSGSNLGSHVLKGIGVAPDRPSIRFSFSKNTTKEEIDFTIDSLKQIFAPKEIKI